MKTWNELSREEKIDQLFNYPYGEREEKVKELWGEDAHEYSRTVWFPRSVPWDEILQVLRNTEEEQHIYFTPKEEDILFIRYDDLEISKMNEEEKIFSRYYSRKMDEFISFQDWRRKILDRAKPKTIQIPIDWYDENTLVSHLCIEEGDYGDEDGFGVEPDVWVSALFDLIGNVVRPFEPGYIFKPSK